MKILLNKFTDSDQSSAHTFIRKCFMLLCSGRNYCKQEVCHFLMNIPYVVKKGLKTIHCNLNGFHLNISERGEVTKAEAVWEKYANRLKNIEMFPDLKGEPDTWNHRLENMTLEQFLKQYNSYQIFPCYSFSRRII